MLLWSLATVAAHWCATLSHQGEDYTCVVCFFLTPHYVLVFVLNQTSIYPETPCSLFAILLPCTGVLTTRSQHLMCQLGYQHKEDLVFL